jgi:uncharacterized membrane protein (UPF0127 family)
LVLWLIPLLPACAFAAPAVPAWRLDTPWSTETATVSFERDTVVAEVADTSELRERGLGYRDELQNGTGMLFVYDSPSERSFWMKGMRFCLDIVWIETGEIRGAAENACPQPGVGDADLTRYVSPEPVTFVLELPAGWLDAHGYETGDDVDVELPQTAT